MVDEDEFLKKQPQQSRSRALVGALVGALEQLLDRSDDLGGISVQRVAERAGVGIGSLYDYFTSRESLFGQYLVRLTDANFVKLKAAVDATDALPMPETVERIIDAVLETYLGKANRTRAATVIVARLNWVTPVIRERDRFAAVVADRIARSYPKLPRERLDQVCKNLCDAVMGLVITQLWRPTGDVRANVLSVTRSLLNQELDLKV